LSIDSPAIKQIQSYCSRFSLGIGFGYIELDKDNLYSSFMVVEKNGKTIDNYRRISPGWKEQIANEYYIEGKNFQTFKFENKNFVSAICGDLWYDENIKKLHNLSFDYVLWPNYNSYSIEYWEDTAKNEYAQRAEIIGENVLWFNSHNNNDDKAY